MNQGTLDGEGGGTSYTFSIVRTVYYSIATPYLSVYLKMDSDGTCGSAYTFCNYLVTNGVYNNSTYGDFTFSGHTAQDCYELFYTTISNDSNVCGINLQPK